MGLRVDQHPARAAEQCSRAEQRSVRAGRRHVSPVGVSPDGCPPPDAAWLRQGGLALVRRAPPGRRGEWREE
eukprot:2666772-Prymnesium_polylepis.1